MRSTSVCGNPWSGPVLRVGLLLAMCQPVVAVAQSSDNQETRAAETGPIAHGQDFRKTIAPMLVSRCLACHGGKTREGSYSLGTFQEMLLPGDSGLSPIVAGDDSASELLRRITTTDLDERMPSEAEPLTAQEIDAIRDWIKAGALFPAADHKLPLVQMREFSTTPAPEVYSKPLAVHALAVAADSSCVFVSGYAEVLQWDLTSSKLLQRLPVAGPHVAAIALSDAGQRLVVSSGLPGDFGVVQLFELSDATSPVTLLTSNDLAPDLCFSPDGSQIAIAGSDGILSVVKLRSDQAPLLEQRTPHADAILALAWSGDGQRLLSAARDRTAKFFDTDQFQLVANYDKHERAVGGVAFADAGPMSFDETGRLRLWAGDHSDGVQADIGKLPRQLQALVAQGNAQFVIDRNRIRRVELKQKEVDDGKDAEGKSKTKQVWRFTELEPLIAPTSSSLTALALKGRTLVAGDSVGQLWVWYRADDNGFALSSPRFVGRP